MNTKNAHQSQYQRFVNDNFDDISYCLNETLETIIARDIKMAYGMPLELEWIERLAALKVFVLEVNDLRGTDR